jgi:hypothetical protein
MRGITYLLGAVVALTVVVVYKAHPSGADGEAAPIFGVKIRNTHADTKNRDLGCVANGTGGA